MTDDIDDVLPPRDHNRPPSEAILRTLDLIKAANAGIAATPMIRDAETAGRFQGFVDQLRDAKADLDAELAAERKPHDDAIAAIKARFADALALIELARTKLQPLLDNWLDTLRQRAEDQRQRKIEQAQELQAEADQLRALAERPNATIEQQLAARRAQEAATNALYVAQRRPTRAAIKGEFSNRAMSMRTYWAAQIVEPDIAIVHFRDHPDVRAAALGAILKVCRKLAIEAKDEAKAPPGIKFVKTERAQ